MGPASRAQETHETFVSVGGQRLWTSIQGRGASFPLLLIMGFGGNMEMWRPLRRALGPYETIAFDAPGLGRSAPPRRPLRAEGMADLVTGMLDNMGYRQVDVLGVSLGGGVAQQLAHQAPERVRKLILCATSVGRGAVGRATIDESGGKSPLQTLSRPSSRARIATPAGRAATLGDRSRDPLIQSDLASIAAQRPSLLGQAAQLYGVIGWSSKTWVSTLRQPTLVMEGAADRIVAPGNGRLLHSLIPDARYYLVHGGGHLFLGFQAQECALVIRDFLA